MNTQGWIRGYIAHNSSIEKFINFILTTISKEFGFEFQLNEDIDDFNIYIDRYKITIDKGIAKNLQKRSPYALDKYILDSLRGQGLDFDEKRSQYVRYCYGIV